MESRQPKQTSEEETPFSIYAKTGLSAEEAARKLHKYGTNDFPEKKANPFRKFMGYFWGPIPWMIEAAAILSIIIQHYEDFAIIFTLLLVNAVVGFWQERKADNAIELLKKRLAPEARVLREGAWRKIPSRELVPGDIVRIRLGDIVPADVKLMKGDYLLADESALTGESLPVEKHISEVAYAGAIVRQGEMDAYVVATGISSFFGKTTKLVAEAKTGSHFQKAVIKIGNYLIILAAIMVSAVVIAALVRQANPLEILQFALVLTVAAIPVALPAVLTVTLAVGAIALAKKEAIVSKLVSIEEMAGVDVLCSDKTGTITKNELTVAEAQAFGKFEGAARLPVRGGNAGVRGSERSAQAPRRGRGSSGRQGAARRGACPAGGCLWRLVSPGRQPRATGQTARLLEAGPGAVRGGHRGGVPAGAFPVCCRLRRGGRDEPGGTCRPGLRAGGGGLVGAGRSAAWLEAAHAAGQGLQHHDGPAGRVPSDPLLSPRKTRGRDPLAERLSPGRNHGVFGLRHAALRPPPQELENRCARVPEGAPGTGRWSRSGPVCGP